MLAQAPQDGRRAAAEALLGVMDMEQMLLDNTEAMLRMQQEQNPELAQFEDIMREFMEKALRWEELKADYLDLYVDLYTEEEMGEMLAFYRSPIGQRMIETMPELMIRSAEISQRRVQKHLPEMMERIFERASNPAPQKSGS
jgi:uncharacterized protein